jgi:hypothetical protein
VTDMIGVWVIEGVYESDWLNSGLTEYGKDRTLDNLLAEGWEPYAVVMIDGKHLFHYLRMKRPV